MALLDPTTNRYIKIELDGSFKIYRSPIERINEKEACSFEKVCQTYSNIIVGLQKNKERKYYDPNFVKLIHAWQQEFSNYTRQHRQGLRRMTFPLIKQYIPDIDKTLPEILEIGSIGVHKDTLTEVYNDIKLRGYFPNSQDC